MQIVINNKLLSEIKKYYKTGFICSEKNIAYFVVACIEYFLIMYIALKIAYARLSSFVCVIYR